MAKYAGLTNWASYIIIIMFKTSIFIQIKFIKIYIEI